jgi:lysophospholipase L1-like esterase
MRHTVDIFVKVLVKLIKTRKFNVFIHPILPILNETRPIVVTYNDIYKEAIDKMKGAKWLDFFDEILITNNGSHWKEEEDISNIHVRNELKLDGTHINPKYISILEKSINSVI